ncbi:MAG: PKD domain-containing protein [Planctomycetota bacterium]
MNKIYLCNLALLFLFFISLSGCGSPLVLSLFTDLYYNSIEETEQPAPTADFTASPTLGQAPLIVQFVDTSQGEITNWYWDFKNDGTAVSLVKNPSYLYAEPGIYTVKLLVKGPGGTDVETKILFINVTAESIPPVADFSATPKTGMAPLTVHFTNFYTGNINFYSWDFDNDGIVDSNEQNPSFTYNTTGSYNVKLKVLGPDGSDEQIKNNFIIVVDEIVPPIADFSAEPTTGTAALTVVFTNLSTDATSWQWDFNNDGTVDSASENPSFSYTSSGTYTVKLTVTGAGGSDEEIKYDFITVSQAPQGAPTADFSATPASGAAPLAVTFTDLSTDATSWQWDFNNDGTLDSTEENPTYVYTNAGTYTVKLLVIGQGGSDVEIKINFITVTEAIYTLSVNTIGNGIVTIDPPLSEGYVSNTEVILTATAVNDYKFSSWSGDASGSTNPIHVIMDKSKTITANFVSIINPILIGSYDMQGEAKNVYVKGNYAYVIDWDSGLLIIDISDPSNPTLSGSYNKQHIESVCVSGNYAYLTDSSALQILNISDTSNPILVGSYNTPGQSVSVYLSGNYAYVSDFLGLRIFNISDPLNATLAGSYDTLGSAWYTYVNGNYAYVADGPNGLQIIQIFE